MFCCVLNLDGEQVSPEMRARYAGRVRALAEGDEVEEVDAGAFVAWVVPARVPLRPLWARRGGRVAVGNVRLDHPEEVRRWGGTREPNASSLELVLDAFQVRGNRCLGEMLGDFSVALYDIRNHELVAARDAFGVKTLFRGDRARSLVLSSHLELIHEEERIDEEFVADFLLAGDPGPERTIWSDSRSIAPGCMLIVKGESSSLERFWTPDTFVPASKGNERDLTAAFLALFQSAVRVRVGPESGIWAELSGGVDSSSVVCVAQQMAAIGANAPLSGVVTLVDELGTGDERRFSDVVTRSLQLRSETVVNPWPWQDDGEPPPRTDEPRTHYPYFSRDRQLCRLVRSAGGSGILSGLGSDHYLAGSRLYMADLVAAGHPIRAVAEVARWAIAARTSMWSSLARDLLLPFVPVGLQRPFRKPWDRVPGWFDRDYARRLGIDSRVEYVRGLKRGALSRYATRIRNDLNELTRWLPRGPFEEGLELRYPFLHRPVVEFSLSLPVGMRTRPLMSKWVLRQAMSGILPEQIRARTGKGGIGSRSLWALRAERKRLGALLNDPVLVQRGIVDRKALRAEVDRAASGGSQLIVLLLSTLALETWLYVRSGRWVQQASEPPKSDLGCDRAQALT
jgi:asparagine synthase (glutamine-hydrolysing)